MKNRIPLRELVRNVLSNPDSHCESVRYYATVCNDWFARRDPAIRTLWNNRYLYHEKLRLQRKHGRHGAKAIRMRTEFIELHGSEAYRLMLATGEIHDNTVVILGKKLRMLIELETCVVDQFHRLFAAYATKDKEGQKRFDSTNIAHFAYWLNPEAVAELMCWRVMNLENRLT